MATGKDPILEGLGMAHLGWTRLPHALPSRSACEEKLRTAAFAKRRVKPYSATAPHGSGTSRKISFLRLFRSSTAIMPNNT